MVLWPMTIRFYLAPMIPVTLRNGRAVLGAPLLQVRRDDERVTVLKMNTGKPRWALVRYEATAARIALADTHPLVIPLPTDRDGRMSVWGRMALEKVGLSLGRRTSTRDAGRLIFGSQGGQDTAPIVMAGDIL